MNDADELCGRAVRAAVAVAARHGVVASDPAVLADRANVLVHLRPAPVVARVATTTGLFRPAVEAYFAREVSVATYLARAGAPVVPPSEELPAGPHRQDGLALTFWRHVEPDGLAAPTPDLVAGMLRDLHATLRSYPGELPYLGTSLGDVEVFLDRGHPALDPADLARFRAAFEELRAQLAEPASPVQPLHGDSHPGNLVPSRAGWLWNDFEDTCSGAVGWDLACLMRTKRFDGAAAVELYGGPSRAALEPYLRLRDLHGTLWYQQLAERFPAYRAGARDRLDAWRQAFDAAFTSQSQ